MYKTLSFFLPVLFFKMIQTHANDNLQTMSTPIRFIPFTFTIILFSFFGTSTSAPDNTRTEPIPMRVEGAVFMPVQMDATEERVSQLQVPAGFKVNKFAEDLGNSRMIAVHPNGTVYVTARDEGKVFLLRDTNRDGKADEKKVVLEKERVHGITIHDNKVYLATIKEVFRGDIRADGTFGELQKIVDNLPDGAQHPNRTLGVGPDNKLYISIGSSCNDCSETNPEHATIVQTNLDGSGRKVYAKGLRNTLGMAWHPQTKEMWGMDHGIDWLGDEEQKEELNRIVEGGNYGWPHVYEKGKLLEKNQPDGMTLEEYAKKTIHPELLYDAHASGMGIVFYTGNQFPQEYQNNAFVAFRGSWNRSQPVGDEVVRVRYQDGKPQRFEKFMTGFLVDGGKGHMGRIVGMALHNDGSLLVVDDANGVVYRVAHEQGAQQRPQPKARPARRGR
ncbi:sorbosone dehydrogenase family protein [soil metagenome]